MNKNNPKTLTNLLEHCKQVFIANHLSLNSRKLYLADIRNFLLYLGGETGVLTLTDLASSKTYRRYIRHLTASGSSRAAVNRALASLRQLGKVVAATYSVANPATKLTFSGTPTLRHSDSPSFPTSPNYIKSFTNHLNSAHLSTRTIKSYKSDAVRYFQWAAKHLGITDLSRLLTDNIIGKYLKDLPNSASSASATVARKSASLSRFAGWYRHTHSLLKQPDSKKITRTSSPAPDLKPIHPRPVTLSTTISFSLLITLLFSLAFFGYRQLARDRVILTQAYPSTPVTPNRQLSFQGRLEDAGGTPITVSTNFVFKLWDAAGSGTPPTGGSQLYTSGTCAITPDSDGVFSTQIGSTCGSAITSSVFTENANVFLEVTVASETLGPRQQIATVAYALNSETLQGFPVSATVSAIKNTIVPMNQWGEILIGEQSPRLTGISGTLQISAPSLSLATTNNGNIALSPHGTGQVNLTGGTTTTNFFNVASSSLTTGSLITGTVSNDNAGLKLIDLSSGSSPTSKFSVTDAGNVTLAGDLTITGDDLFMTTNIAGMLLIADGNNFNPTAMSGDVTITGTGATTIGADKITEGMLKSVNGPTDELCLSYEETTGDFEWQTCGSGGGGSNWRYNLGSLSPLNDTVDLLIGGNATSAAKFAVIGVNTTTPTASVSGGVNSDAAYLTSTGTLATARKQTLTLGDVNTGNLVLAPGGTTALTAIGADLTAAGNLTLTTASNLIFGSTTLAETTSAVDSGAYVVGVFDEFDNSDSANVQAVLNDLDADITTALSGSSIWTDEGAYLRPTGGEVLGNSAAAGANKLAGLYLADSAPLVFGADNDISFSFSGSTLGSTFAAGSMLGLNTATALATFDVRSSLGTIPVASISGNTSMAALIVDQSGTGDIFTASSSGEPRFVVKSNGNVGIGVADPTSKLQVGGASSTISNSSGDITIDSFGGNIVFGTDDDLLPTLGAGDANLGSVALPWDTLYAGSIFGTGSELGIGIAAPDTDLHVYSTGITLIRSEGAVASNTGYEIYQAGNYRWGIVTPGSTTDLRFYDGTGDRLTLKNGGKVGIGSTDPTALFQVTGAVTGKALAIFDETGDQDIIVASASGVTRFRVGTDGYTHAARFVDTASTSNYLDPAATATSLAIAGDILNTDNATFTISGTNNNDIVIDAGSGTVIIGDGTDKLDAGTVDPPYTINGEKFATYMAGMTGVKEETTGTALTQEYVPEVGYRATLDLGNSPEGSDLWLFTKVTDLKNQLDRLVVLISSSQNTRTWYELDPLRGWLHLYSAVPARLSYRLTAPRFDSTRWSNERDPASGSIGHVINDNDPWSVSELLAAAVTPAQIAQADSDAATPQMIASQVQTDLLSPLASGSAIVVSSSLAPRSPLPALAVDPILVVEGELTAATVSAREAKFEAITASKLYADEIIARSITADSITGLDARLASISAGTSQSLSDSELESLTARIKARIASLAGDSPTASDLPVPIESADSANLPDPADSDLSATQSATLASADIDFATINNYLAVVGQATITTLDVTNSLTVSTIQSSSTLSLQPLGGTVNLAADTLTVDSTGQVAVKGDLLVSGQILAGSVETNSLSLGSPVSATASALGQLLAIYNEQGETVATIDASGSANLASVTTQLISISAGSPATPSASATAGQSIIVSPTTELTLESPYITENSLVYLTPTTDTGNQVLYVKDKESCKLSAVRCTPSFTVAIASPTASDISFNWWIIELEGQHD